MDRITVTIAYNTVIAIIKMRVNANQIIWNNSL